MKFSENRAASTMDTSKVSVNALSWAADCAGMSYGKFCAKLNANQMLQIQKDYEAHRKQQLLSREEEKKTRSSSKKRAKETGVCVGYILGDDDP